MRLMSSIKTTNIAKIYEILTEFNLFTDLIDIIINYANDIEYGQEYYKILDYFVNTNRMFKRYLSSDRNLNIFWWCEHFYIYKYYTITHEIIINLFNYIDILFNLFTQYYLVNTRKNIIMEISVETRGFKYFFLKDCIEYYYECEYNILITKKINNIKYTVITIDNYDSNFIAIFTYN